MSINQSVVSTLLKEMPSELWDVAVDICGRLSSIQENVGDFANGFWKWAIASQIPATEEDVAEATRIVLAADYSTNRIMQLARTCDLVPAEQRDKHPNLLMTHFELAAALQKEGVADAFTVLKKAEEMTHKRGGRRPSARMLEATMRGVVPPTVDVPQFEGVLVEPDALTVSARIFNFIMSLRTTEDDRVIVDEILRLARLLEARVRSRQRVAL